MLHRLASSVRNNVFTGALVLVPITAVLWILARLWSAIMGLSDVIPTAYHPTFVGAEPLMDLFILVLLVFFLWFVGLISRNYFGKKLLRKISRFFNSMPVLRIVYSTLEQLLKTFGGEGQSKNFRRVVVVEYPREGLFALAFVTGERGDLLNIYVPTTPNPTSGFYLSVPAKNVRDADMTVEEALKEIISMGIVQKSGAADER